MAIDVAILRVNWNGWSGGPGLTQLAIDYQGDVPAVEASADAVRNFLFGVRTFIPQSILLTISQDLDLFDSTTGVLSGSITMSAAPSGVQGSYVGDWSAAAGFQVGWKTSAIQNGRRVAGRTFIVPAAGCFDVDGTLESSAVTSIGTAAQALVDANTANPTAPVSIWGRPSEGKPASFAPISGYSVPDQGAVLRSRRD